MTDYGFILFFIAFSVILAVVLFSVSFLLISKNADLEKVSPYECGFDPFEDTRDRFEIRFYLVAILFIIFDLEVVFLFPWTVIFPYMNYTAFFIMIAFLIILTIGFVYEWLKGALDWE